MSTPLSDSEFAVLMSSLGPFEHTPHLAVAVSGGADSMALCLLADRWAQKRGGRVSALCVDHGLRPESSQEARQVKQWLESRQISCHCLTWIGEKPATGIQEAARNARFSLLRQWCREQGVLHLLLAHHQNDQAETFLLRLKAKSGPAGLAAMAAIVEEADLRLLRPVLDQPKARLQAVLEACHQPWIEDPSNTNDRYGRVALRLLMPQLAAQGLTSATLTQAATHLGQIRIAQETEISALAAAVLRIYPAGFVRCDLAAILAAGAHGERLLSRILACIGGNTTYGPGADAVRRILDRLRMKQPGMASLSGCLLIPSFRQNCLWVCREIRRKNSPVAQFDATGHAVWDRRFHFSLKGKTSAIGTWSVQALGEEGLVEVLKKEYCRKNSRFSVSGCKKEYKRWPRVVYHSLPAIFNEDGLVFVPHLEYEHEKQWGDAKIHAAIVSFRPEIPATMIGGYLAYE